MLSYYSKIQNFPFPWFILLTQYNCYESDGKPDDTEMVTAVSHTKTCRIRSGPQRNGQFWREGKTPRSLCMRECVTDVLAKSNGRKCEHLLQRMRPHSRQWCRRRVRVKCRPQVMHNDTSESGAHDTTDFSNAAFTHTHTHSLHRFLNIFLR